MLTFVFMVYIDTFSQKPSYLQWMEYKQVGAYPLGKITKSSKKQYDTFQVRFQAAMKFSSILERGVLRDV